MIDTLLNTIDLRVLWFFVVGLLLTGYAILDGFDLGVGMLHLFTRQDEERQLMMASIGPVWNGNEVWLVTGGGALFAAFPTVYAEVFSGFYLAMMLLLVGLIFRAIAIEFRNKYHHPVWRQTWDVAFCVSSFTNALVIGVALGNIAQGLPLNEHHQFVGTFLNLFSPYTLLVGLTTVAMCVMHGAIYTVLKTDGVLQEKAKGWVREGIAFFVVCYVAVSMATLLYLPHLTDVFRDRPWLSILAILNILAVANIPREIYLNRPLRAFFSSCFAVMLMMAVFGLGMFPNLVYNTLDPANSLSIYNGSASKKTLETMTIIALVGMPLVLSYTASIYWIFRHKVTLADAGAYGNPRLEGEAVPQSS